MSIKLTILFSTFRRPDILRMTLDSYVKMDLPRNEWELIVVDNECSETIETLVLSYVKSLPLRYCRERTRGKSAALNSVIGEARGNIVVFTDDDICFPADFAGLVEECLLRWPEHVLFSCKIQPDFPASRPMLDFNDDLVRGAFAIADWHFDEGSEDFSPSMAWGVVIVRSDVLRKGYTFNTELGPNAGQYTMGNETEFVRRICENENTRPIFLPSISVKHIIREEQLSKKWLFRRSYRAGKGKALEKDFRSTKRLYGRPRYLYRLVLEALLIYFGSFVTRKGKIEKGMRFWHALGMLHNSAQR